MRRVDRLLVELGQQDMRYSVDDRLRRALQQIGKADMNFALAQPDGGVERGEPPEAHQNRRHGRARAQRPVLLLKDGDKVGRHHLQDTKGSGKFQGQ